MRRRRIAGWIAGIILGLGLICVVGVVLVLRSAAFQNYVLRTVQQQASDSLNTPVRVGGLSLRLSHLNADLFNIVIMGQGPGANLPLLQADHLGVQVRVTSILRRQWYFENIVIDYPVVHAVVDQHGNNNFPTPKQSGSKTNVFDLGIRHVVLRQGEVHYNDHKDSLNADLHDFGFESRYTDVDGGRYFGSLGYHDGQVQVGAYSPIAHDLQARFDARRSRMTLEELVLKSGSSQLIVKASLDDYSQPRAHASYQVTLSTNDLRRDLRNPNVPSGVVEVNGVADYQSNPNRPFLDALTAEGQLLSHELLVSTSSLRTAVRDVGATFRLSNGNLELQRMRAKLLGGELSAQLTVRHLGGEQDGHLSAQLQGVSLAALRSVAQAKELDQVGLRGKANAKADAKWTQSISNLVAVADLNVSGSLNPAEQSSTRFVPVDALIHARYTNSNGELALDQSYLRTPQTQVNLNGTISHRSSLQIQVQAKDLHELDVITQMFRAPKSGQLPAPLGLYGVASFNAEVRGSTSAPQITGHLNANDVRIHGAAFRLVRANIVANPSLVSIQQAELQPASQGHLTLSLQAGLKNWSYTPSSPITANVQGSRLSVAELKQAANLSQDISGTLDANISLHGSQLNPQGQGQVTLTNGRISGEPVSNAKIQFNGTGKAVHAVLQAQAPAGAAQGELTYYPQDQGYEGQLQVRNIQLDKVQTLRGRNFHAAGTLTVTASGRGTLKAPQLVARVEAPQIQIQNEQIRNLVFQGSVQNQTATFDLNSQVLNTPLRSHGTVRLTDDYYTEASLDTPVIPLQPFLAAYLPAQAAEMKGETEIHATLRGPLKKRDALQARLNISRLQLQYRDIQLGAVQPIRADFVNGVLQLQPGEIKGTGTDIHFQGSMPTNSTAPSTLNLVGTLDLKLAQMLNPDISSSGQIQFDIRAGGVKGSRNALGEIRIVNATVATNLEPLVLQKGNGVLTLQNDRLEVTQFTAQVGGGTVTASGGVVYRPQLQFNVAVSAMGMHILYPDTVRTEMDAKLALTGNMQAALLSGQINVNRISFTPDFDLAKFASQFSGESSPPPAGSFEDALQLNIGVQSASNINIQSRMLSIQGGANLRVRGTAADPVLLGRANLTGGDMIFLGNRYKIQGGTIAFINPVRTEPVLNLAVNTTIQQYNITMRLQGPLERLHTNYSSDPALPPADIINLVAFGKTTEAPGTATGNLGAQSLLAQGASSQVSSRVEKAAGISHLSIDPVFGGNGQNPGARLAIQQRVTSNLYVNFVSDVTSTQQQTVQIEYRVSPRWTVSGVRDQNGGFGFDARFHKDF